MDLATLEAAQRDLGNTIGRAIPEGVGFCLILYTSGEGGWSTYMSNAQRPDMMEALREMLSKLEQAEAMAEPPADSDRKTVYEWLKRLGIRPSIRAAYNAMAKRPEHYGSPLEIAKALIEDERHARGS